MPPKPPKEIGEGRSATPRPSKRLGNEVASKSRRPSVLAVSVKFGKARKTLLLRPNALAPGVDKVTEATWRVQIQI